MIKEKDILPYPPRIARKGFLGFPRALPKYSSSFFMRNPAALIGN